MKKLFAVFSLALFLCMAACAQTDDIQATSTDVAITIAEDGRTAQVVGYEGEKYARVAMIMDHNGETGLYLTTCKIDDNGAVTIPRFDVPGVDVVSISVAVADNTESLLLPDPNVIASEHIDF